ncbi:uncharacterized protein ACJ7VT_009053 isoform 2-T2 [Polymixia lowei]
MLADKARSKTRINIGIAFERWRKLREIKGLKSDAELAVFLLDNYERNQTASTPSKRTDFPPPQPPLSSTAADSDWESIETTSVDEEQATDLMNSVIDWEEEETGYREVASGDDLLAGDDRAGDAPSSPFPVGTVPVIGLDGRVHDVPTLDPGSEDMPSFPERVLCHDGDGNVRRLATFLHLPVQKFPYSKPVTGTECAGKPPFEVTMASRGTGTILEQAVSPADVHNGGSDPNVPEIIAVITDESSSSDEGEKSKEGDTDTSDSEWDPSEDHSLLSEERMDKDSNDEQNPGESPVGIRRRQLCPECGAFFNNIKPHTCEYKIKPYSCNICGKRCVSEHSLKVHCKIHKEDYVHRCKFCLAAFKTRLDKLRHEWTHPYSKMPYQCPDCSETFSNIRERKEHLHGHRGPNRHVCHVCNMEFLNMSQIQRHMAVHTGEKPFVCEFCQRSFNQPSHLKSHMRLHTGERPFKCPHCDKSFNHNVSLKSHVQRYHSQVKTNPIKSEADGDEVEESGGHEERASEFNHLDEDEEEQEEEDTTKKTKRRSSGRPKGRPKTKRESSGRGRGRPETSEAEEDDTDSDFDPAEKRKRKKGGGQNLKGTGRGRGRGRAKKNPAV